MPSPLDIARLPYPIDPKNRPQITTQVELGNYDILACQLIARLSKIADDPDLTIGKSQSHIRLAQWWQRSLFLKFVLGKNEDDHTALRVLSETKLIATENGALGSEAIHSILDNAMWWLLTSASAYGINNGPEEKLA